MTISVDGVDISSIQPFMLKGEDGISVTSALIGQDGHLRVTLSNDSTVDAGDIGASLANTYVSQANNLSDLPNKPTARTNLGLGDASTHPASDFPLASWRRTVQSFGVVGDGTTDDTTALQSAITWATANGGTLSAEQLSIKITAPVVVGLGSRFTLNFPGTVITQATDNTPIFRFTKEDTNDFAIIGCSFQWTNFQAAANTSAIALAFDPDTQTGHGIYNFHLDRLYCINGFNLMGLLQATSVSNPIWGWSAHRIHGGVAMTGPVIDLVQPAGAPNCRITNFYARRDQSTLPTIRLRTCTVTIDGFEVNQGTDTAISLDACTAFKLTNVRAETWKMQTAGAALFSFTTSSHGTLDVVQVQSLTQQAGAGNNCYLISAQSSTTAIVNALDLQNLTITSGSVYALAAAGSNFVEFNNYAITGTAPSGTFAPDGTSSKVIRQNNIFPQGVQGGQDILSLNSNGAVTFNLLLGNVHRVTLAANATSSSFSNLTTARAGMVITIVWIQDGTGSRTYAWPTACKFAAGTAPTASTTANWRDAVTFEVGPDLNLYELSRSIGIH